jgi:hypothetical protein
MIANGFLVPAIRNPEALIARGADIEFGSVGLRGPQPNCGKQKKQ